MFKLSLSMLTSFDLENCRIIPINQESIVQTENPSHWPYNTEFFAKQTVSAPVVASSIKSPSVTLFKINALPDSPLKIVIIFIPYLPTDRIEEKDENGSNGFYLAWLRLF